MTLLELVVVAGGAELLALLAVLGAMARRPRVRLRLGGEARRPESRGAPVTARPAA